MSKQGQVRNIDAHHAKFGYLAHGTHSQPSADSSALNTVLRVIADKAHFDLTQATDLTKTAILQDPELEIKLIQFIRSGKASADEVIRVIRIFECLCSKSELLDRLLRLEGVDHPRIRSKVVLTIGRLVQNAVWLREQLQDPNARVRANAVEALWGVQVEGSEELLLRAALDLDNRVIGNAAYSLYKLGNSKAIPILYSLLRHSDTRFRNTGLWVITQLGDPRFLDFLQTPPNYSLESREAELRVTAQQRLAAYLHSSQFAGKLDIHLSSFKTASHRTRIAKFHCLSPAFDVWFGPSDLNKLSFIIDEGGKQVEDFECRWIDPVEPIFCAAVVPAGLGLRSRSLRALVEEAALGEAVSIFRYLPSSASTLRDNRSWLAERQTISFSNGFSSQSIPVGGNLYETILKGLEKLNNSHGLRHLFLVVDGSVGGKLPANLQKMARISNTVIHASVAEDVHDELAQMLSALSLKSGGTFVRSDSAETLPATVSSVRACHAGSFELCWTGLEKDLADVKIQCISACGYAELAIPKPHK